MIGDERPKHRHGGAPGDGLPLSVVGATWLAAFLVSLDYTALNVALPSLGRAEHAGTSAIAWTAMAYMLTTVALLPVAGQTLGRFGYRRSLLGALAVFLVASLACALAPNLWCLIGGRALQGCGAAVMMVVGQASVARFVPEAAQRRAYAIFATGPVAGMCAGPALGGLLTAAFGWQAVFLINIPLTGIAMILCRSLGSERDDEAASRLPSLAVLVPVVGGLAALILAVNKGQEWGWTSPPVLALMAVALLLLALFGLAERRAARPLVDRTLLHSRNFRGSALVFVLVLFTYGGLIFLLPFYLEWFGGLSTAVTGQLLVALPLSTLAASSAAGFLPESIPPRALGAGGLVLVAFGIGLLGLFDPGAGVPSLLGAFVLIGLGMGMVYPATMHLGMSGLPRSLAASASGTQTMIRVMAQMLGVAVLESVFSQIDPAVLEGGRHNGGTVDASLALAFRVVLVLGAGITLLGLMPALRRTEP